MAEIPAVLTRMTNQRRDVDRSAVATPNLNSLKPTTLRPSQTSFPSAGGGESISQRTVVPGINSLTEDKSKFLGLIDLLMEIISNS